jgi:hypothetical protein
VIKTRDAIERIAATLPKRVIVGERGPYLERYTLRELQDGSMVYLHHFVRGDEDRELHSHPWSGRSTILVGGYREERRLSDGSVFSYDLKPGMTNTLLPDTFHRVDLYDETCWTLFEVTARCQSWGFWNRETGCFTPWREYLVARGLPVDLQSA